ncbi:MAG: flippase [Erythrobacter sp.]|nr:flippase [Erythrobacter sp.]
MSVGRNSLLNIAGALVPLIVALVTIPLFIGLIGTERYGALAVAWLVLGYFGMFDLGLGPATAQRIASLDHSTPEHRARVFWTAFVVNVAVGLVGGALLYAGMRYFLVEQFKADPLLIAEMLEALPWLALAVPVATLTGVARGGLQGRGKFLDINVANILSTSLFQILPLVVAYLNGPSLTALVMAAVAGRIIGFVIIYARVHRHLLRALPVGFDRAEWLPLLKFGGWVSITTMIGPLMVASDRLLIGALLSASAVAVYSVAFDIARRISLVPQAYGMAAFPQFARLDAEASHRLTQRSIGALGLVMTAPLVALLFLIEPFLKLWLGVDLGTEAADPARILIIAYWGNAFAVIPFVRIQGHGRPHVVTLATLAQAPLLIAALYFATEAAGLVGAALAVAVRANFEVLVLLFLLERRIVLPKSYLAGLVLMVGAFILSREWSVTSLVGASSMVILSAIAFAATWVLAPLPSRADFKSVLDKVTAKLSSRWA